MAIKLSQSLKQTQNLMMTPQLQQAIKLLTLTHLEMSNVIAEEMVDNPMLEEIDADPADYNLEKLEMQNQEANTESFEQAPAVGGDDFDWNSYVDSYNSSSSSAPSMTSFDSEDTPNYENMVSQSLSLADHLEWQLRMEELTEEEMNIASLIIHNINDDGYLATSMEDLIAESKADRELCLDIQRMIQELDPVGCACETLVDCLLAQARIAEERSPLLERIIRDHLEDLKNRDHKKISKTIGVSESQIMASAELLKNFHPKPGRLISPQETHYVVPDIYVKEVSGEFAVQVNDEGIPRLKVSQLYQQMLKKGAAKDSSAEDDEASKYVQEKLNSALFLIKSIQRRQSTITKVAKAIVSQQQDFFKKGPKYLKPMVLKDVANEIGMHESTVSRVTTNKYMHTPIGLFELKYFFNTGVGGKNGSADISSEVLKIKIKALVENESPKRPLSDQKIAELLSRDGVEVARRTVAKYREMLDIDSSARRKVK